MGYAQNRFAHHILKQMRIQKQVLEVGKLRYRRGTMRSVPNPFRQVLARLDSQIGSPPLTTQAAMLSNQPPTMPSKRRRSAIDGIGNVFLLGMTVLISEVLDLTAAQSLEYLLEPCQKKEQESEQALADEVGIIDIGLEEGEAVPFANF